MDQQPGNQPSRPELTCGEALCAAVEAHLGNSFVRMSPLKSILPLVVAHVRATDARVHALIERLDALEKWIDGEAPDPPLPPLTDLQAKLLHVVNVARKEGQL